MKEFRQYGFTYGGPQEKERLIAVLREKGYVSDTVTVEEPMVNHVHAVCADEKTATFYYMNAACAAGWSQAGRTFYSAADCETVLPRVGRK